MSKVYRCARALSAGREYQDFAFVIEGGLITAAGPRSEVMTPRDAAIAEFGDDVIVTPGFINGHSHAYQILLRGWADDLPFAKWRSDALYHVVPRLSPDDIYDVFTLAFHEMLSAGISTVAEFFYLNGNGNDHAEAAIRAAKDAGIRLVFARTWMDAPYAPPEFRESIEQAQERTLELLERYGDVNLCVAPHSLHAASAEMIKAAHDFACEHDLLMHLHLAEAAYEGEETLAKFGATPVHLLRNLGVLDQRLVAIHAIYLSEEEKDLIAHAGGRVVHNPMTNQYLGDGTCDVTGFLRRGVHVGLGTDADVKPSLFEEMRAAANLQKLAHRDSGKIQAEAAFGLGTALGARALGLDAGLLRAGYAADFTVIDAGRIDPWSPALNALVYRAENSWVQQTYVAGKCVYDASRPPQKLNQLRASLHQRLDLRRKNE